MLTILSAVATWMVVGMVWLVSRSVAGVEGEPTHGSYIMPAVFVMALVSSGVNGLVGAKRATLHSDTWSLVGALLCCAGLVASGYFLLTQIPALT